jgi:hypothetical protein
VEPAKAPVEAAKTPEPAKPDTKVLEPTPTPGMIPAPAPVTDAPKDTAKDAKDVKKEGEKAAKDKAAADGAKGELPRRRRRRKRPPRPSSSTSPWGEIFVNGKSGSRRLKKFIKLTRVLQDRVPHLTFPRRSRVSSPRHASHVEASIPPTSPSRRHRLAAIALVAAGCE